MIIHLLRPRKKEEGGKPFLCRPGATSQVWEYVEITPSTTFSECAQDCNNREDCAGFDFSVLIEYPHLQSDGDCRMVDSVVDRQAPRMWNGPDGHKREFCKRHYTCKDFAGSCPEVSKLPDTWCGTSECTDESDCCLSFSESCTINQKCSAYDGICDPETHAKKLDFATRRCGPRPCTVDHCCDAYEDVFTCEFGSLISGAFVTLELSGSNSFQSCAQVCERNNCDAFDYSEMDMKVSCRVVPAGQTPRRNNRNARTYKWSYCKRISNLLDDINTGAFGAGGGSNAAIVMEEEEDSTLSTGITFEMTTTTFLIFTVLMMTS